MKKLTVVARILLGLIYFVFGLNGFLMFLPVPEMPEPAMKLMTAFTEAGYFLVVLKLVEVLCGFLLLIGRFVPLALILLAPVVVQIVLFHLFLAPAGIALGLVSLILGLFLAWSYRSSFGGVLAANASPG